MVTAICETRLCPDCGIEIRCESDDGNMVYYFIGDRQVVSCPECGSDLTYNKLQAVREPKPGKNRGAPAPAVNKAGLISALKEKNSFFNRKADSERALNLLGEVLFQNLAQGKDVIWSDLGRFKITRRKARKGRNPQTEAEIIIPARTYGTLCAGQKAQGGP